VCEPKVKDTSAHDERSLAKPRIWL
jgi:hypothetical protein